MDDVLVLHHASFSRSRYIPSPYLRTNVFTPEAIDLTECLMNQLSMAIDWNTAYGVQIGTRIFRTEPAVDLEHARLYIIHHSKTLLGQQAYSRASECCSIYRLPFTPPYGSMPILLTFDLRGTEQTSIGDFETNRPFESRVPHANISARRKKQELHNMGIMLPRIFATRFSANDSRSCNGHADKQYTPYRKVDFFPVSIPSNSE